MDLMSAIDCKVAIGPIIVECLLQYMAAIIDILSFTGGGRWFIYLVQRCPGCN